MFKLSVLAAVLSLLAAPLGAAQVNGQFNVTVTLQSVNSPTLPQSAFCTTNPGGLAFGATVTVVCSTGAFVALAPGRSGLPWSPMHGGAYQYIFHANRGGEVLGAVDSYVGIGTTTSWRVVNLANWDYFEMTMAW